MNSVDERRLAACKVPIVAQFFELILCEFLHSVRIFLLFSKNVICHFKFRCTIIASNRWRVKISILIYIYDLFSFQMWIVGFIFMA